MEVPLPRPDLQEVILTMITDEPDTNDSHDVQVNDDDDDDDDGGDELSLSKFVVEMSSQLGLHRHGNTSSMWVFWSQEVYQDHDNSGSSQIQEAIRSALCELTIGVPRLLVQFWAPVKVSGQCLLTTLDQPFALSAMDNGLQEYRKNCLSYKFNVEGEDNLLIGPVGRVFRSRLPESSPRVGYYSIEEYPQRDHAIHCDLQYSYTLPVFEFERSAPCCVGVLELVGSGDFPLPNHVNNEVKRVLQGVGLRSHVTEDLIVNEMPEGLQCAKDELQEVLRLVFETHQIRLAQTWVLYSLNRAAMFGDNLDESCINLDASSTKQVLAKKVLEHFGEENDYRVFRHACDAYHLRIGQGLVWRDILTHKQYFCHDVSQFSIIEYPLAHYARLQALGSYFAICTRSAHTRNLEYLIEFFLPSCQSNCNIEAQNSLDSILTTLKQYFRTFKVFSPEDQGNELSFQESIAEATMNNEHDSIGAEQSNDFTSLKTITTVRKSDQEHTKTGDTSEGIAVSQSTLKSTCRKPNIFNELSSNRSNTIGTSSDLMHTSGFGQFVNEQFVEPVQSVKLVQEEKMVTVKASFGEDNIKFLLPSSSVMEDLVKEMTKRLPVLNDKAYSIKYLDDEDEWILITCDEDLWTCMDGCITVIRMLIQQKKDTPYLLQNLSLEGGHAIVNVPEDRVASVRSRKAFLGWLKLKAAIRMLGVFMGIKKRRGQVVSFWKSGYSLAKLKAAVRVLGLFISVRKQRTSTISFWKRGYGMAKLKAAVRILGLFSSIKKRRWRKAPNEQISEIEAEEEPS